MKREVDIDGFMKDSSGQYGRVRYENAHAFETLAPFLEEPSRLFDLAAELNESVAKCKFGVVRFAAPVEGDGPFPDLGTPTEMLGPKSRGPGGVPRTIVFPELGLSIPERDTRKVIEMLYDLPFRLRLAREGKAGVENFRRQLLGDLERLQRYLVTPVEHFFDDDDIPSLEVHEVPIDGDNKRKIVVTGEKLITVGANDIRDTNELTVYLDAPVINEVTVMAALQQRYDLLAERMKRSMHKIARQICLELASDNKLSYGDDELSQLRKVAEERVREIDQI